MTVKIMYLIIENVANYNSQIIISVYCSLVTLADNSTKVGSSNLSGLPTQRPTIIRVGTSLGSGAELSC